MKKLWVGIIALYGAIFFVYSRQWFLQDFVFFRKDISNDSLILFISGALGGLIALGTFFVFQRPIIRQKFHWFLHRLSQIERRRFFLGIASVAIAVRILWFIMDMICLGPEFFYDLLSGASRYSMVMAEQLVSGKGYTWNGTPISIRPPGYSFLLSLSFILFGIGKPWLLLLFNLFSSIGIIFYAYQFSKSLFGKTTARLTSLLATFSWPEIYHACYLLEETVFTFLFILTAFLIVSQKKCFYPMTILLAFLLFWLSFVMGYFSIGTVIGFVGFVLLLTLGWRFPQWHHAMGVGVSLGLSCYFRPTLFLLPCLLPVAYRLLGHSFKKAIQISAVSLVAMLTTLSPWIVRNSLANQTLTFISTNGGGTLFEDNWELCHRDPEFERYIKLDSDNAQTYTIISERRVEDPVKVNPGQTDKELGRYTLRCIVRYPIDFLKISVRRTIAFFLNANQVLVSMVFWKAIQQPLVWSFYRVTQLVNVWFYGAILLLFFVGVFLAFKNRPRQLTLLVFLFYMFIFQIFFTTPSRYRLPIWSFVYAYTTFAFESLFKQKQSSKGFANIKSDDTPSPHKTTPPYGNTR